MAAGQVPTAGEWGEGDAQSKEDEAKVVERLKQWCYV